MGPQGNTPFFPPTSILGQVRDSMNAGQPPLNQVSAQSPTFQPQLQQPPEQPMPEKSPMSKFAQGLTPQGGQPGQSNQLQNHPQNPLEARRDMIVKALTSHLASLDKMFQGGQ